MTVKAPIPPVPPTMPQVGMPAGNLPDFSASGRDAIEGVQQRADEARQRGEVAATAAQRRGEHMDDAPVHRESATEHDNRTPEARAGTQADDQSGRQDMEGAGGSAEISPQIAVPAQTMKENGVSREGIQDTESIRSGQSMQTQDSSLLAEGYHPAGFDFSVLLFLIPAAIIAGVVFQKFFRTKESGMFADDTGTLFSAQGIETRRTQKRTAEGRVPHDIEMLSKLQPPAREDAMPKAIPKERMATPPSLAERLHALALATQNVELNTTPQEAKKKRGQASGEGDTTASREGTHNTQNTQERKSFEVRI